MRGNGQFRVAVLGKERSILTWFGDLQEGFRKAGAEVLGIGIQAATSEEREVQRREGAKEWDNPAVVERVRGEITRFAPDLVVVQNRAGLPQVAVDGWSEFLGEIPTIGWLCDNLAEAPAGQVACFDRIYYFDSGCIPALKAFYKNRPDTVIEFLPLAVNPDRYPHRMPQRRKSSIVFAGKCSEHRRRFFEEVRGQGVPLEVYGPGCRDWLRPWRARRLSADKLARVYSDHLACLNLPQPGNTDQGLNLRAFEVPCCGGIGLYPPVDDLARCFNSDEEIFSYRDLSELARIVGDLAKNPDLVESVAKAGRERVLSEHTFTHRAERMIRDVGGR